MPPPWRTYAPVLTFHGDRDRNIGMQESREMAEKLRAAGKQADYVEFHGLDHQLDDSDARSQLLARAGAFLDRALELP